MGTPWWGLSIWTGVWQEEKGGGVLFNLAECDRPPLPVVIWKTCEYSVLVPTGGREEGQLTLIKHLLPVGMSLGAGSPLARKEWEGGSGHDGGFWQNWDLVLSFLAWNCSCLLTPFPSFSLSSGVTLSHVSKALPLSGRWGGCEGPVSVTSPIHWGWEEKPKPTGGVDMEARMLVTWGLGLRKTYFWLLGLPLTSHGILGKSLYFIWSLHLSIVFGKLRFQSQPTWV